MHTGIRRTGREKTFVSAAGWGLRSPCVLGSRMDFKGHLPTQFKPPEREHDDRAARHDKEEGELPAAFGEMLPIDRLHF